MIDLTPLDVRKKRGDFRKGLRGYDPQEVDTFLELAAERLEVLVKENLTLKERSDVLAEQVQSQESRERAVQEALVTAQTLREEIAQQAGKEAQVLKEQAQREADMLTEQARQEVRQLREQADAEVAQLKQKSAGDSELLRRETESELERLTVELEALIEEKTGLLEELERKRKRFLRAFRSLLERELDGVAIEEGRVATEEAVLELDLTGGTRRARAKMIETEALGLLSGGAAEAVEDALEASPAANAAVVEEPPPVAMAPEAAATDEAEAPAEDPPRAAAAEPRGEAPEEPEAPEAAEAPTAEAATLEAPAVEAAAVEAVAVEAAAVEDTSDGLDSLVDRVLSEQDQSNRPDPVPVGTLAPEADEPVDGPAEDTLDTTARSAVSELFDREVTVSETTEMEGQVSAWDKVLRGDDANGEDAGVQDEEAAEDLTPNFPDGDKPEDSSAWSRRRGQSRWR